MPKHRKGRKPFSSNSKSRRKKKRSRIRDTQHVFEAGDADSGDDEMKDARRYDKDSLTSYEYKLDPEEFEDEEIDEDMAFNEEDKVKYAAFFPDLQRSDEDEDEDEDEEFGDDVGGDEDLSSLLIAPPAASTRRSAKAVSSSSSSSSKHVADESDSDSDSDGSDEEEEEEEAVEEDSLPSSDDDDDADVDDDKHKQLLAMLGALDKEDKEATKGKRRPTRYQQSEVDQQIGDSARKLKKLPQVAVDVPESQFGVIPDASGQAKLTLADLMAPLSKDKGFSSLRKQMSVLTKYKSGQREDAPMEDIRKDEITRSVVYTTSKKDVSKWQPIVKANREASTLSFAGPKTSPSAVASTSALAAKFTPSHSLEKDLDSILQTFGMKEEHKVAAEERELALNKLSEEDVSSRQAELGKMKALLFYHEQKQRRINKSKSRSYRRLRKRLREKNELDLEELERLDPDAARRKKKKIEFNRARERMTLKHKNMSKWVKRQLRRAKDVGAAAHTAGTRQAIAEQLQLGEELRHKMATIDSAEESSDSDAENDDFVGVGSSSEDEDDETRAKRAKEKRRQKLEAIRKSLHNGPEANAAPKGIFALKFMQRAMEKERLAAMQSLEELEAQLNEEEQDSEDSEEEDDEDGGSEPEEDEEEEKADAGSKRAQKVKFLGNTMQLEKVGQSSGSALHVDGALTVKAPTTTKKRTRSKRSRNKPASSATSTADAVANVVAAVAAADNDEANPWAASVQNQRKAKRQTSLEQQKLESKVKLDVSNPILLKTSDPSSGSYSFAAPTSAVPAAAQPDTTDTVSQAPGASEPQQSQDDKDTDVAEMTQEQLVKEAFALAGGEAEDFEKEKNAIVEDNAPKVKVDPVLPGWGSWGGSGVRKRKRKKLTKQEQRVAKQQEEADKAKAAAARARKDHKLQHVIINEKRDKKFLKYTVPNVPHPFQSKEHYERSLQHPVGPDWNTRRQFQGLTKPAVITQAGNIIEPIKFNEASAAVQAKQPSKAAKAKAKAKANGSKKRRKRHKKAKTSK